MAIFIDKPVLPSLPELTDVQAVQNTDREVWRETPGDFYSNSVHLTATGGLGINVGGTVYVKPPAEWHRLASLSRAPAEPAYYGDGKGAFPTHVIAKWPETNRARFNVPLYAHPTESAGPAPAEVVRELTEKVKVLRDACHVAFFALTDPRIGQWHYMEGSQIYSDFKEASGALAAALKLGESHEG